MNQEKQKAIFTRNDTIMVKGIAILLLLVHHMGGTNPGVPLSFQGLSLSVALEHLGKVCVALFTVLSGYGITEGSKKHEKKLPYVCRHIKKILFGFWGIFLLTLLCNLAQGFSPWQIYGNGLRGVLYLIKDFLGLQNFLIVTPSLCGLYWYIECIFVCYLIFPALNILFDKLKKWDVLLLVLTFMPWVYYLVKQDYMMHTDRELFYIFSFCIGMYLSKHQILNRWKETAETHKFWLAAVPVAGCAVLALLRLKICLPMDGFFAVSIICACIFTINRIPETFVGRMITVFGKCEFELYLLHPVIFGWFSGMVFVRGIYRKIFLIAVSTCIAYSWKKLKEHHFFFSVKEKVKREELEKHERNHISGRSGNEALPSDDGDLEAAITRIR